MRMRWPIAVVAAVFLTASCASDGERQTTSTQEQRAVEAAVRASFDAENEKDVDTFLALWTDDGLAEYDVGTREDLEAGATEDLGQDPGEIIGFDDTTVSGGTASTLVDVTRLNSQIVKPLFRLKFELVQRDDEWLLDGFEFVGGVPAQEGTEAIDIRAQEYAFVLGRDEVPGDVAFKFANAGKEPHEITLFKGPDDLTIERAAEDLADVDGSELDNVPEGYQVDHVAFAEPGQTTDVAFAEAVPSGTYVLACYIPEGGFPEDGEPDPNAKPHFQLGMRGLLKVE